MKDRHRSTIRSPYDVPHFLCICDLEPKEKFQSVRTHILLAHISTLALYMQCIYVCVYAYVKYNTKYILYMYNDAGVLHQCHFALYFT